MNVGYSAYLRRPRHGHPQSHILGRNLSFALLSNLSLRQEVFGEEQRRV